MAHYMNSGDGDISHYEAMDVNQPKPSNIYLQGAGTTAQQGKRGVSGGALTLNVHDQTQSKKKAENSRPVAHYVQWTVLYLALVIIIVLLIWMKAEQTVEDEALQGGSGYQNTSILPTTYSCLDLKARGMTNDGIYDVKLPGESLPIKVYCDMTTNGGGWTLVASVHEDEIQRKCDAQDLWSTYLTRDRAEHAGKGNWENDFTFGSVLHLHVRDYKNAGYFTMNASNVMIWHVVQGFQIASLKSSTKLRYRTNNKFLENYGGNLQTLYDKHFPLKVDTATEYLARREAQATTVLDALERNSTAIKSKFPDFYEYSYGSSLNQIQDSNLYSSYGNYLYFYGSGCNYYGFSYGQSRSCAGSALLSSRKSHPFFSVAVISSEEDRSLDFYLRVHSYRPNAYDVTSFHTNTLTNGNFKLEYHVVQYSRNSTFTTCEFHYVVSNLKDWNSVETTSFRRNQHYSSSSNTYRYTTYVIAGNPLSNIVMGYVLLARQNSGYVTDSQLDNVGREILNVFTNLTTLFTLGKQYTGLSVPVTFDQGTYTDVMNMIPPNYKAFVEPGFIQFRAYNASGFPNALCPGIMLKTLAAIPDYICIGGVSGNVAEHGTCGDFAGWNGKQDDKVQKITAVGSAHSFEDITSTILIFYR